MTIAQRKRFYGPAWRTAWQACWIRDKGAILPRAGRHSAAEGSGLPRPDDVDRIAADFARSEIRPVNESDLRRACRLISLGKDIPDAADLGNGHEVERVVCCFKLLANPDDIGAGMTWTNPDRDSTRRWIHGIRRSGFSDTYIQSVASSLYADGHWTGLPPHRLRALSELVWRKKKARDRSAA
jgi:hypothetical protein